MKKRENIIEIAWAFGDGENSNGNVWLVMGIHVEGKKGRGRPKKRWTCIYGSDIWWALQV